MKRIPALVAFVLVVLLMFVLAVSTPSIAAQEATVEANPVSIVTAEPEGNITVEDGGTVIVNEAPIETPVTPVDNSPAGWIAAGLGVLVTIMVGVSLALQVAGNRAQAIANNPAVLATLEQGYDISVPEIIKTAIEPLKESLERSDAALKNVLDLVEKLTDGVPELSKPVTPPANPSAYTSTSSVSPTPPNRDQM